MTSIRKLFIGIALTLGISAAAHAAPPIGGGGGGYYGGAEFANSSAGATVGPYPTYAECNAALQAAINNAVNNGYVVEEIDYCFYRPPFTGVFVTYTGLAVQSTTPRESLAEALALLEEVAEVRARYSVDKYEAELRAISKASNGY